MLKNKLEILNHNLKNITSSELVLRLLFLFVGSNLLSELKKHFLDSLEVKFGIGEIIYYAILFSYSYWGVNWIAQKFESGIFSSPDSYLTPISKFCFSSKNNKEIFEPIVTDWQGEYFEALFKKEVWKARWINLRYTYAFLAAMWQKSPIGDLIEFVSKLAK